MKWGHPEILGLLWLVLPAAWIFWRLARRQARLLNQFVQPPLHSEVVPAFHRAAFFRKSMFWLAAVSLVVVALARPQFGFHWEEVKRRGLDIMVVLDTSRSMLTEDLKPNRIQQAKWGIRDLAGQLRGDRIGLVSFAGSSFLQCPLTIDYAAFMMTLEDVYVGIIPKGGTDIGQALETAAAAFEKAGESDRVIVLVTDGEDHGGGSEKLQDLLKEKKIKLFAIGVGTLEGELIPENRDGRVGYYKNRQGNPVKSALKEDTLEALALASGGAYVRCAPGDFGLEKVLQQGIAGLKRSEQESKMVKAHEERFAWALGCAIFLLAVEAAFSSRKRPAGSRRKNEQLTDGGPAQ